MHFAMQSRVSETLTSDRWDTRSTLYHSTLGVVIVPRHLQAGVTVKPSLAAPSVEPLGCVDASYAGFMCL